MNPTQEEVKEMHRVKLYFPYRLVFGVRESDGFHVYATSTKHKMNKFLRDGFVVFSFGA